MIVFDPVSELATNRISAFVKEKGRAICNDLSMVEIHIIPGTKEGRIVQVWLRSSARKRSIRRDGVE